MEPTITIENIVASTRLAEDFDLQKLLDTGLKGAVYNKNKFPGLVYRIENPKAAFLIFASGKVVCTGTKNVENSRIALFNLANELNSIGYKGIYLKPEIHVQNVVASANLRTSLNLNAVLSAFGVENVEYEPEVFPGLVYKLADPRVVVLVFRTGKLVITGGKCPEDCEEGLRIIKTQLDNLGLLY
ncbi:TPA: TATA-box-binding protein [Methanosarcina acetivorans]|uniref:TATA-box-binding protein 2 n=2 Tax=Methanosarcina acetivorans TaxID=2214 RepID=TBP2_METAC|nr:TATA-box-binding protein [Methanosarcina acetivorans]Q8TU94.1 RecName: Full=TATA-box-binding protein 2; AltName: Full=Box A-binding protein 2; Short=BAP 2; AltName: Full=TATA sequence-binding protein 2; Short=TBP 2; AltName: Full=TATA-box factor 2 [Methanosarcina acetivorans C2A]AAM03632.1 TATA-binding protein [Methanosarcina acetivorans C2A]HIH95366.1 TATA-box-binding protein [Methanosarcina acetivorans]